MKNKLQVIGAFVLGLSVSGIAAYAASNLLASQISYKDGTVEDALNKIYQNIGTSTTIPCSGEMINHTWTYNYEGEDFKLFIPPCEGTYKVEAWGAQGGNASYNGHAMHGGYGGYSVGNIEVRQGDYYFVYVGSQGGYNGGNEGKASGGYNGGGAGYTSSSGVVGGGGGATHVATKLGKLAELESDRDKIIIVAGGGGGAISNSTYTSTDNGGNAGGYIGSVSSDYVTSRTQTNLGTGGSQSTGGTSSLFYNSSYNSISNNVSYGKFGQGGTYSGTAGYIPGGGSGYYGGAASYLASGTGGSSYINTSMLSNAKMVCNNCATSNTAATKTESNTCHNATATSECSKEGNGMVKFTLVSYN